MVVVKRTSSRVWAWVHIIYIYKYTVGAATGGCGILVYSYVSAGEEKERDSLRPYRYRSYYIYIYMYYKYILCWRYSVIYFISLLTIPHYILLCLLLFGVRVPRVVHACNKMLRHSQFLFFTWLILQWSHYLFVLQLDCSF